MSEVNLSSLRRFAMGHEGEVWCSECEGWPVVGEGGDLAEMVTQALAHNAATHGPADVASPAEVRVPLADLLLVIDDAGANPYQEHYAALGRVEALIPKPVAGEVSPTSART